MPVEFDDDGNEIPIKKPLNGYNRTQRIVGTVAIWIAVFVLLWVLGWVQLSPGASAITTTPTNQEIPTATLDTADPTAITLPTVEPMPTEVSQPQTIDVVLIGNDYVEGRGLECPTCLPVHSDAFIYVHVVLDEVAPRVSMFSLPRELYVHVEGIEPDSKINQLYPRGGTEYVELWVNAVLGVELDAVIVIDMDMYEQVIDDIGGIDVVARQTFTDQCGSEAFTYIKDAAYHLDGYTALCYARMRWYNPDGYFARQERHMDILLSMFNAVVAEFKDDPLVTSVRFVSEYSNRISANASVNVLIQMLADSVLVYYSSEEDADIDMYSLEEKYLELYPRPTNESPFLYKPVEGFDIAQWVECKARQSEGCERP